MTAAKPPARQRAVGALASGSAIAELHHQLGHNHLHLDSKAPQPCTHSPAKIVECPRSKSCLDGCLLQRREPLRPTTHTTPLKW